MRSHTLYIVLAAFSIILSSCNKQDDETHMNIVIAPTPTEFNIAINSSTTAGTDLAEIPLNYNLDSLVKDQNARFGTNNIETLKLSEISFLLLDTPRVDYTFSNIENASIFIQATGQSRSAALATVSTPETEQPAIIGSLSPTLTATDNDLKSYLTGSAVKFILTGKLRTPTTKILRVRLTTKYRATMSL